MNDKRFPYWRLLWEMTSVEMKLRDQGTLLGFLWTLLHPALMFAVLYGLFLRWMGKFVEQYAAYLLVGIVLWNFFQRATAEGLRSLIKNGRIVRNYKFQREIVVLSSVCAAFWSSLLEVCVLLLVLFFLGIFPRWTWAFLPVILCIEFALVAGLSLFLAILAVEYQDMERIWDVLTRALFYLTPVFYPLHIITAPKQRLLLLSPLTQLVEAARACVIQGRVPSWAMLALLAGLGGAALAAGRALLRRLEFHLMDRLLV